MPTFLRPLVFRLAHTTAVLLISSGHSNNRFPPLAPLVPTDLCKHVGHFLLNELVSCQRSPKLLSKYSNIITLCSHSIWLIVDFEVCVYLSRVYCWAVSRQNSAAPNVPQAIP